MNSSEPGPVFGARVEPAGWAFEAPASQPLMKAALAAGIRLPRSCRNGTCRACMCRLLAGRVNYRIEWPGLSAEEKHDGFILPCVAHPESDLILEVPGAQRLEASRPRT